VQAFFEEEKIRFFLNILIACIGIPFLAQYVFGGANSLFIVMTFIYLSIFVVVFFVTNKIPDRIMNKEIRGKMIWKILFHAICATLLAYTLFELVSHNEFFGLSGFRLSGVYTIRAQLDLSGLLGYTFNWSTKVVIPLYFLMAVSRKKWGLSIMIVALELVFFLYTGHKAVLFILPVMCVIYIFQRMRNLGIRLFGLAGAGAAFVIIFSSVSSGILQLGSLTFRRVLAVPALLSTYYMDFADKTGYIHFSDGRLGALLRNEYPYPLSISQMIGLNYMGSTTGANTGLIGHGYLEGGVLGVVLTGIIAAVLFALMWFLLKGRSPDFFLPLCVPSILGLVNSSILTNILTGGLGLMIVLCALYRVAGYCLQNNSEAEGVSLPRQAVSAVIQRPAMKKWDKIRLPEVLLSARTFLIACIFFSLFTIGLATNFPSLSFSSDLKGNIEQQEMEAQLKSLNAEKIVALTEDIAQDPFEELSVSDKCYYIQAFLIFDKRNFAAIMSNADNQKLFRACWESIVGAVNQYTALSDSDKILLFGTIVEGTKKQLVEDFGSATDTICDYWMANPAPESLGDKAQLAAVLKKAGDYGVISDERIPDIEGIANQLYFDCTERMDKSIGIPLWYDEVDGELYGFTEIAMILDGLAGFDTENEKDGLNGHSNTVFTYDNSDRVVAIGSTVAQISGAIALFEYDKDMSYREQGWIDGFTTDPGTIPIASERGMAYMLHINNYLYMPTTNIIESFYQVAFENGVYTDKYIGLYCHALQY
jgi:hypothetical protein